MSLEATSGTVTDVPTNNANEPRRPPLDAGDLSRPTRNQKFGPGTIITPVVLTSETGKTKLRKIMVPTRATVFYQIDFAARSNPFDSIYPDLLKGNCA